MTQPEGYSQDKSSVCPLKKSLYGLKQASRQWNLCFTTFLKRFNLQPLIKDNCIFARQEKDSHILNIALYVDDGLIICNNKDMILSVIKALESEFQIKLMDPHCFVGLEIVRDRKNRSLFVNQGQ